MKPTVRRVLVVVATAGLAWGLAHPATAQTEGPCSGTFNGVAADRISGLSTPLELDAADQLVFAGTDSTGTQEARIELVLGPIPIDSGTTTYGPSQTEFSASLDLADTSPYGVGLFRIRGTTDDCVVDAWLRITGRHPMATLTGLTAAGLAVGGLTGQLTSIVSRRRGSPYVAAAAGLATGAGAALIGQQFGRLQISFISVGLIMAAFAAIGFVVAWRLRHPSERPMWEAEDEARVHLHTPLRAADPAPIEEASPAERVPSPAQNGGPYWCYVMADVDVLDLANHTSVVATLRPGTWYLARREASGWVHVVASEGTEGWVAGTAIHRQG